MYILLSLIPIVTLIAELAGILVVSIQISLV